MHYLDIELEGIDKHGNKKNYKLSDFKGKNVILYFYPQDGTPVCTEEAHRFRDAMNELEKYAEVIGVSEDDTDSHIEFQKLHKLNFTMLSDKLNKLKNAFQDHTENTPIIHRATFILDKDGKIIKSWEKVDIENQIYDIKTFFKEYNNL